MNKMQIIEARQLRKTDKKVETRSVKNPTPAAAASP